MEGVVVSRGSWMFCTKVRGGFSGAAEQEANGPARLATMPTARTSRLMAARASSGPDRAAAVFLKSNFKTINLYYSP